MHARPLAAIALTFHLSEARKVELSTFLSSGTGRVALVPCSDPPPPLSLPLGWGYYNYVVFPFNVCILRPPICRMFHLHTSKTTVAGLPPTT
ncbi:hypothetical protein B0T22DRAFT_454810 [Podospora appendiculata]|uniref:Uncharacterized protein n=1 Tax=Podospora appendiculata TaxID=314037 RepID=A0AAE0XKR4_9PEZI|nr:hypothetical protein B0T22DRAFT_454810 [Podospora appendiculata]